MFGRRAARYMAESDGGFRLVLVCFCALAAGRYTYSPYIHVYIYMHLLPVGGGAAIYVSWPGPVWGVFSRYTRDSAPDMRGARFGSIIMLTIVRGMMLVVVVAVPSAFPLPARPGGAGTPHGQGARRVDNQITREPACTAGTDRYCAVPAAAQVFACFMPWAASP